ncbi:MAG TPA: tetratricopeptide repeat protein [Vicinamibacterales bacterium]|jgi:type II secretory pathway component GspD/PulD (secretin)|nr:tetratricopeptide repeat protein [Vicinamibacterales bacterium]
MTKLHLKIAALVTVVALVAGCGASRFYGRGQSAAKAGNWDVAVEQYQHAIQEDPNNAEYGIALQRAMMSASVAHLDQAKMFEARGQMDDALREYRRASEYDPPNRQIAGKVSEIERRMRDAIEAARPRPTTPQVQAPRPPGAGPAPLANLNSVVDPARFNQANLRDVINTLAEAAGIQAQYERDYQDRTVSLTLDRITLGEALQQVLTNSGNFYKVVNQRTILVIPDNPQKRQQYDEQVVQTFYLSHSDSAEVSASLNNILNIPGAQTQRPAIIPNKTSNSITARAAASVMPLIERLVQMQDTPRAEVLVDLQILEVSKARTRLYGLNLSDYAIRGVFSPEVDPRGSDGSLNTPAFNANTVSKGISAADFYLAVPSAVVRFLENDERTKVMAKPQLRGAEGATIRFNLGEEIPILSTAFTPIAGGGSNVNPLTSYTYRPIGIIVEMTPRVTYQDEISLELKLENSSLGVPIDVAGQSIPKFTVRKVETKLRLREGESTLLAGLLQDEERTSATGLPGLTSLPIVRQLFGNNRSVVNQTDVVMLLTPRIVRTHELTKEDLAPLFIGTQNSLGLGTPPPLIAAAEAPAPAPAQPPTIFPAPAAAGVPAGPVGGVPAGIAVLPPGSSAFPGTTSVPAAAVPGQGAASGQIVVSPPAAEFRVGAGPYNVPISISGASQISNVAVTVTYNPAVLRMRAVAEGSFMRSGGVNATFTQSGDATTGRVDIAIVRPGDMTGVAGTGLLAALLFEPVAPGQANLTVSATATAPSGMPVPLQFTPIPPVTVR